MTLIGITPKQKQVLEFIHSFTEEKGYAPSQQEIARHFDFKSLGTVQNYLVRLERIGALKKTWNARRGASITSIAKPQPRQSLSGAELLAKERSTVLIPLLGFVAAGRPIEAISNHESIDVPQGMLKSGSSNFVLKVRGDSMIEDGILDGDHVVIRKKSVAENGQTIVALINGEATIKRYYKFENRIELHAANPAYKPIVVRAEENVSFKIEGILSGVIRLLK